MSEQAPAWASEWQWRDGVRELSRNDWSPGPWDAEPDRVVWREPGLPFPMLIARQNLGALCGYVGVPPGHPAHGQQFGKLPDAVQCAPHGGVTYSEGCAGRVCHTPQPGEPDELWWLGFDCIHVDDAAPGLPSLIGRYRTLEYVQANCRELARALAEMAGGVP